MPKYKIYTLSCPITNQVFYVGITKKSLKDRLKAHIGDNANLVKARFIFSLREKGLKPKIELLEVYYSELKVRYFEMYWINQFMAWGFNLLNMKIPTKKFSSHYIPIHQSIYERNQFEVYKRNSGLLKNKSNIVNA